jgi:hypothetical protein
VIFECKCSNVWGEKDRMEWGGFDLENLEFVQKEGGKEYKSNCQKCGKSVSTFVKDGVAEIIKRCPSEVARASK